MRKRNYSKHISPLVSSRLNTVVCSTQPTKFLPTNSHLPSAHQCPTRLKNTLCTLSDIIFSQLFETVRIRPTGARTLRPIQDTCVLTISSPGLWNYQQLDHINQWERWDLGESPSFSFPPLFFLLPFVNVQRNTTASNSVIHKLTICLWFDVKNFKMRFL